mgnify:CR=1 FL=1|tara:strand:+ start:586 stop:1086 length:501 start_codon:yes stop_codon:yes gene_type:complete
MKEIYSDLLGGGILIVCLITAGILYGVLNNQRPVVLVSSLLVILIVSLAVSSVRFAKRNQIIKKEWMDLEDGFEECPQFANYLNSYQQQFPAWPICMIFSSIVCLIVGIVLFVLRTTFEQISYDVITIIILVTWLVTFTTMYKMTACILYRICMGGSCTKLAPKQS